MSSPTVVRRLFRDALPAVAALLLAACTAAPPAVPGAAVTPPRVSQAPLPLLTPTVRPSSLSPVERFAWQRVVELGEAFDAGDVNGFLGKVSSGFYRGYATLEASLRRLLEGAADREAVVAIREVSEEEGRVSVRAEWTRRITRGDGRVEALHGETVFLFLKSDTSLRLLDYRGAAPFGIEGI